MTENDLNYVKGHKHWVKCQHVLLEEIENNISYYNKEIKIKQQKLDLEIQQLEIERENLNSTISNYGKWESNIL